MRQLQAQFVFQTLEGRAESTQRLGNLVYDVHVSVCRDKKPFKMSELDQPMISVTGLRNSPPSALKKRKSCLENGAAGLSIDPRSTGRPGDGSPKALENTSLALEQRGAG